MNGIQALIHFHFENTKVMFCSLSINANNTLYIAHLANIIFITANEHRRYIITAAKNIENICLWASLNIAVNDKWFAGVFGLEK